MAQRYSVRPSELIGIQDDEYLSYCFDEACHFIMTKIDSGAEIRFKKSYKTFADIYKGYNF